MMHIKSYISQKTLDEASSVQGDLIRKEIFALIQKDYPEFSESDYISNKEMNYYRKLHLTRLISEESEEIDHLEREVLNAVANHSILSENIEEEIEEELTIGQQLADTVAKFGGSWRFLIIFFVFIIVWMCINIFIYVERPFDPYPFILLNLILSTLAAVQAPIIMMSQNRITEIDRIRDEHEYKINLKAELEIKLLMEKVDHIILKQNKRLLDIQNIQGDYLEDILERLNGGV